MAIDDEAVLNAYYEDLLGRPIDTEGLDIFLPEIEDGTETFGEVALTIAQSPEYDEVQIGRWYEAYLGREATTPEVEAWTNQIEDGASLQTVLAAILGSSEFYTNAGGTNADFVNQLFQDLLGRPPTLQESQAFVAELNEGGTLQTVAATLLASPEYLGDLVTGWYQAYLGREPAPNALHDFVTVLQDGVTEQQIQADILGSDEFIDSVACFCRGTRILTERGEVAVEMLAVGDRLVTAAGETRPVKWLGHRALRCGRHPDPATVRPVRIASGAFGDGLPARDLWLSPGHNIAIDGVLIPIGALQNGVTIVQEEPDAVEYWHVELDRHDVILAEGLPAESYLDTGNRTAFANGGAFVEAHPDFAPRYWTDTCLPLVLDGPEIVATKARLLSRLAARGDAETTADADAHIVADGVRIEPIALGQTRLAFVLPAGCGVIALRSRTFVPAHVRAESSDGRRLGLCIGRLQLDGAEAALLDPVAFDAGWHAPEAAHRWTRGAVPLPAGTRLVVIDLAGLGRYRAAEVAAWPQPVFRHQ